MLRQKFEKYRVIQDRLFMSDFDRYMLELEESAKNNDRIPGRADEIRQLKPLRVYGQSAVRAAVRTSIGVLTPNRF